MEGPRIHLSRSSFITKGGVHSMVKIGSKKHTHFAAWEREEVGSKLFLFKEISPILLLTVILEYLLHSYT